MRTSSTVVPAAISGADGSGHPFKPWHVMAVVAGPHLEDSPVLAHALVLATHARQPVRLTVVVDVHNWMTLRAIAQSSGHVIPVLPTDLVGQRRWLDARLAGHTVTVAMLSTPFPRQAVVPASPGDRADLVIIGASRSSNRLARHARRHHALVMRHGD